MIFWKIQKIRKVTVYFGPDGEQGWAGPFPIFGKFPKKKRGPGFTGPAGWALGPAAGRATQGWQAGPGQLPGRAWRRAGFAGQADRAASAHGPGREQAGAG